MVQRNDIRKGMRLVFNKDTTLHRSQGYGRMKVKADSEIVVTAVFNDSANGKVSETNWTWRFNFEDVHLESRTLGTPPEGALPADDPRVAWVFKDAARMADRLGLCRDFDRITDALGFPGRERTWKIASEADGLKLTIEVEAHSRKEALEMVRSKVGALPSITSVKAISA
jgi:hypothetical protein